MRTVVYSPQKTDREPVQPMPPLAADQLDALRDDIAAHGVLVPITVDQHGRVIDGNNRAAIAAELGVDCPSVTVDVPDDDAALDLAVTLNCARRHLTQEQKRELIRSEIRRRPEDTDRAVARRVGCSPTTVGSVRRQVSNLDTPAEQPGEPFDEVAFEEAIKKARGALFALGGHAIGGCVSVTEVVGAMAMARTRFLRRGSGEPEVARLFAELVYDYVIEVTAWEETREAFPANPLRRMSPAQRDEIIADIVSMGDAVHPVDVRSEPV